MALEAKDQRVLAEAVEALRQGLGERLVAVVLFGSRARGEATPHSDYDLLVLAEGLPERPLERSLFLKRLLPAQYRGAMAVLAKAPRAFEANLPSLYLDIALDGEILYDPKGYAAERLAKLKHLIGELGLSREVTDAGFLWRWKKQPVAGWTLAWEE
jgi:predicted nucleotidyltransferase